MIESNELAKIIQEGITKGLMQKAKGTTTLIPNTPFTPKILSFTLPDRFKYPRIKEYDGTTDPINHLNIYTDIMNLRVTPDQVMCKAFPQTLTNAVRGWFSTFEPNSITSFSDLADKFSAFFVNSKRIRKTAAFLMQLRQEQNETLRNFMTRCEAFKMSLSKTPLTSVIDLLTRAEKYINMEETIFPRKDATPSTKLEHRRPHDLIFIKIVLKSNILMEIKDMKELKWPSRMKSLLKSRDKNEYCEFHRDHEHTTEGCFALE
ncbi:uncharacterized protein LOC111375032 [Olea europaea var. sylvestris]|uniref:uncharacterized protein LOC111375032 n=1 Tax=Olea europaea var. sylvestris TaxID=158386 RepID=UPI000C1D7DE7|nr:uncharacterized protein LOC111375032 [Olea europaea var. sylvestris]